MDSSEFDKKIREKVSSYQDTIVDHGALENLNHRLDQKTSSSYLQYRVAATLAIALFLIGLLNYTFISNLKTDYNKDLNKSYWELDQKETELEALQLKLKQLDVEKKIDTIIIYKALLNTSNEVRIENTDEYGANTFSSLSTRTNYDPRGYNLGKSDEIHNEVKAFLDYYQLAYLGEDGNLYMKYGNNPDKIKSLGPEIALLGVDPLHPTEPVTNNKKAKPLKPAKIKLPASLVRKIEKSKMNGIGFQYGPEFSLHSVSTDLSSGDFGYRLGINTEFILSPSLRIVTGANFGSYSYETSKIPVGNILREFPGQDSNLGELSEIQASSYSINIPLHLKYMYPIKQNQYLFLTAGITPNILIGQTFEYIYSIDINSGLDDYTVNITASKREDEAVLYAGTFDVGFGFEKKLKNSNYLALSAFYNRSMGRIGIENREYNFIGIKSAFNFRVK